MDKRVATIILAAGNSERFGKPKPFLKFDDNYNFLEQIVSVYDKFGTIQIIVVIRDTLTDNLLSSINKFALSKIKIVKNSNNSFGRFYSLQLGVGSLTETNYCFIQNIDNPFVDIKTLNEIYTNKNENSSIHPLYKGLGGHPFMLSRFILDKIKHESNFDINIREFLNRFNRIKVDVENENVLININTPEDYAFHFH